MVSTEAQIYRYNQVSLGTSTALASKSSDLGTALIWERPGVQIFRFNGLETAWSPNLQILEQPVESKSSDLGT